MKKFALLIAFVLSLFTACSSAPNSPAPNPSASKLDLEELAENVYVDYDRTKYENVSAPPVYYAEYIKPDDSTLASLFVDPPKIYDDIIPGMRNHRKFENEHERGYYNLHGQVSYSTDDGGDIHTVSRICFNENMSSVKELDFMSLEELYKKFDEDVRKFIDNYEIFEMTAVTADIFEDIAAHYEHPSGIERVFCEPEDFYFIRARQFINDIPLFKGISPTNSDTMNHFGARIEAGYTKNGLEYFGITGYRIIEEKKVDEKFIDLKGAEQIIRDYYQMPYGPIYERLYDCALVYVAVFEGEKTVLTPAWEFYCDYYGYELGERPWEDLGSPAIRINAYTGEFMR